MAQPVVQTIHRDPALFWWILLPITVVMILTGILRHYAMTLLQSAPKKQALPQIRQQRCLVRGVQLRQNANVLSPISFQARKAYMVSAYQEGKFLAEPENRGKPRPNPMSDPAAMEGMMGMMKGNMAMMIPQTLIMGWINAFFSGFVISEWLKLPFPLTPQFKSMLQSGVGTRDLDVRWVSSLSWYFLTLFGLQPVYNFILGSNNSANQVTQQMAMANPGAGMMGPEQDPDKLFLSEAENLEVLEHRWILEGIEDRLIAKMAS
ncbi:transmembrane protein [Massarina eburnea CBS 473.64]|uniref:ER membrane protein complex subunit 3 n=1 Tax=Massarina eburnea CBS 473.64 TaxID=1395130 RepID=A0A6A6RIM7_9PLEO|nr:transmembrane protein [Massarina eburnea CBS 473.64]